MNNNPDYTPEDIKPPHYKAGDFDVIAFCQHHNINFSLGTAIKYLVRAGRKPGEPKAKDLKKAIEFIEREMKHDEQQYQTEKG